MILYPVRVQSQEFVDRGDRDHLPVGQHRDTVADGVERVEVVCDEEDGKAERVAQLRDELVEAGGAARVQAGGRPVEEQKLRVEREGEGAAGARLHAARTLGRYCGPGVGGRPPLTN